VPTTDLVNYHLNNSAQQKIKGVYDLPPASTRLVDQEIKGEDEYNLELQEGTPVVPEIDLVDEPPNFAFIDQTSANLLNNEGRQKPNTGNQLQGGDNEPILENE
jgi:hypothetical protein